MVVFYTNPQVSSDLHQTCAIRMFHQLKTSSRRLYVTFTRHVTSKSYSKPKPKVELSSYALLSVPIATFCLGTWQVQRRSWKLNLIEEVTAQNKAPPIDFPDDLEELSNMEYRRVRLHGQFDHSKELYIAPRQLVADSEGGGIMSTRSQTGSYVITPFHITDKDITILVNRGWVPRNKTDPNNRMEGQVKGEIDLVGAVRLNEERPQFSPKNKDGTKIFLYRDLPKMSQLTGALPVLVDADASSTVPGGPIGGQTRISFRNEHLSYIITWYSLSAFTSFMWYKRYFHFA